ncbi:hypothetical protein BGW41_001071 [Actinomortierella wolfii]|nr:hypothetical protein BGW41_001071 [Actinomortierella wolfii]
MIGVLTALALQIAFLAKVVQLENYPSSFILSSTLYIVSISVNGIRDTLPLIKLLFAIVALAIFVLENFPKANHASLTRPNAHVSTRQPNPSPEPYSNFFARITFLWVLPLLNKGKKKSLRMDDIWSLHPKLLSHTLFMTSQAKLEADQALAHQQAEDHKVVAGQTDKSEDTARKVDLFGIIMHTVGWSFLSAAIPRLLYIPSLYVRPILFSSLINFMDSYTSRYIEAGGVPQPVWQGFGFAIAVFVTSVLSNIFDAQFNNICFQSAIRARGAFVGLLYHKALRLSSTNKQEGIGAIVNHMSTDVDRVIALFPVVHYIWSGLVELVIVVVQLYREIKYAMFASLGVVLVLIVICGGIAPQISKYEKLMMKESDKRMKLITELVNHIKAIKLYVWERYFIKNITESRARQLEHLKQFYLWITGISAIFNMVNVFAIFTALTTYTAIATPDQPLDIRRIFVTITLIHMLEGPLTQVSGALPTFISGKVAFDRLKKYMESEEICSDNLERHPDPEASDIAYEIRDGTFGWYTPAAIKTITEEREKEAKEKAEKSEKEAKEKEKKEMKNMSSEKGEGTKDIMDVTNEELASEERPTDNTSLSNVSSRDTLGPVLHNISLTVKRGSLTAVVGRVGEGKSSLIGALLGEMHKYSGTVRSYGRLAYVAQSAWILSDTVRNNILFGREYDQEKYLQVVHACALDSDFKMLVSGDKTKVGEKGINLSGGQKQRIAIARAVYADADVYIFDDPLSAVDAHVDRHIFEEVINKLLAQKTRILVTNGVHHLSNVDQIVVIKDGRITQDGSYEKLIVDTDGDLYRLVQESKLTHGVKKEVESADEESLIETPQDSESVSDLSKRPEVHRQKTTKWGEKKDDLDLTDHQNIDDEVKIEGRVGWNVYKYYLKAVGMKACIAFVFACIACMILEFNTQLWLKNWGSDNEKPVPTHGRTYWMLTYLCWMMSGMLMITMMVGITMVVMARRASKNLHASMLVPMIRSPMSFFDVTSSGKVINRFSHDISSIDIELPANFLTLLFLVTAVILQFAFAVAATAYFLILLAILLACYYYLAGYFLVSSRELKRLDSAARSPMYAHFGETLNGLMTLRGFGEAERFAMQATKMLDQSQQVYYLTNSTQRWLQMMLAFLSDIVLGFIAVMAVVQRNTASAGVFAIVLSQIGTLTGFVSSMMMEYCQIETNIVSVERVREYSQLKPEAPDVIPGSDLDDQWPQQGKIEFRNYSTRYREGLDLVLKNINFTIQPGERVGIVGRTGAGKSSVTLALFRIIEAAEGTILVDDVDISTLGLNDLRSRLTIIPQDPFLFGGTIRSNLDPFGEFQDADIWAALEEASLKPHVSSLPDGLQSAIENGGESMSLGQRQLMSLARAMRLRNTRILCLDEATAAIDIETDNAIQRALRKSFKDCTVLTIAHRINTIMDSDRILVLDHGRVAEFDTPQRLLGDPNGIFYSLVKTNDAVRSDIHS